MQQKLIAEAADWTPAYLSQFLSKDSGQGVRTPSAPKMRSLIRALYVLAESHPPAIAAIRRELAPIAELYGVKIEGPTPPSEPIRPHAPNFVERKKVSSFLDTYLARPGVFTIEGAPSTGLSTHLGEVALRLRETGRHVVAVDVTDLFDATPIDLDRPNSARQAILAAIVADAKGRVEVPEDEYEAETLLRQHLQGYPGGFALVIDNLDKLPISHAERLDSWFRQWKRYRAEGSSTFLNTTVWGAFTSESIDAQVRSWLHTDQALRIEWFDEDEVYALSESFTPAVVVQGAQSDWARAVSTAAYRRFAGQPLLSHQFIWDRSLDASTDADPDPSTPGPYRQHLDRLCDNLIRLCGQQLAIEVAESLNQDGRQLPGPVAEVATGRLRVARSMDGTPANAFYGTHLAARMNYRIGQLDLAAARSRG